ncbi:MAG TPA: DUF4349 domain-containing protein [Pyrinomonadaceae bacterium]|nr:DUF4349 domain-containing protein [Pyrinomonadaceae bacterium]
MIKSFLCMVFVCLSIAACGGERSVSSMSNSAANSNKISFGVYDMSRSSPFSVVTDAMKPETNLAAAPTVVSTAALPNQGGGGGGGAREEGSFTPTKISLAQTTAASIDTSSSDRKIIRNAELDLEADTPDDAQRKIASIAELRGGFVVESQQSSSDMATTTRDIVVMTVRVPSDKFSDTLADIRNVAKRIVTENVKGQDVTEEFIDIEAQLKAKKALEAQFMEIMKRANTVSDALEVQGQLAEVRGEIEQVEGRKRFLENQSSMSTIKIRLQTPKVFAAASVGFGDRVADSFTSGADVALNFVLGMVTFLIAAFPMALFVGLPAFVLIRYVWKRQAGPRSVVELAGEELKIT